MLKNFITDNDLKAFYPKISAQIWSTVADYSVQIQKAYDNLINDLWNRGINPRLVMIPLDLKRSATVEPNDPLNSTSEIVSTTGLAQRASNQRRFVVTPTAVTGQWTVQLQGSNKQSEPSVTDASWQDIASLTIPTTILTERSIIITNQFRWYRYKSTAGTAGTSMTSTISVVETIYDNLIIHGACVIIFSDWMKETNDIWDNRRASAQLLYDSGLNAVRVSYDENDDGFIDGADAIRNTSITLCR